MKISIITLQNIRNYGSVLQALATQKVFEDLGCEVEFFNYFKPSTSTISKRLRRWTKGFSLIKKIIYSAILIPSFVKEERIFKSFIAKYLKVQKQRVSVLDDFKKLPMTSDVYCTGSDQTWNSSWNDGVLPELFLSFVPQGKRKIAYAASFGKTHLDEAEIIKTKELISSYFAVSVRESSAVNIVKKLGKEATLVLDPTLQVSPDFWLEIFNIKICKKKEPYVLIYQLNSNKDFDKYAKIFAKKKGLKLVRFCIRHYQAIRCGKPMIMPNVEDFVRLIANASYVITDSFHATAFSINLNTDMICIYPHEFGGRIQNILQLTGLQNRHLTNFDDFNIADQPVDFARTNKILEHERVKGWSFLRKALANGIYNG
jgi:hypothetical protein